MAEINEADRITAMRALGWDPETDDMAAASSIAQREVASVAQALADQCAELTDELTELRALKARVEEWRNSLGLDSTMHWRTIRRLDEILGDV